jgi:hypothetical protein
LRVLPDINKKLPAQAVIRGRSDKLQNEYKRFFLLKEGEVCDWITKETRNWKKLGRQNCGK